MILAAFPLIEKDACILGNVSRIGARSQLPSVEASGGPREFCGGRICTTSQASQYHVGASTAPSSNREKHSPCLNPVLINSGLATSLWALIRCRPHGKTRPDLLPRDTGHVLCTD